MLTSRRLRRLTIPAVGLLAALPALVPTDARANSVELRTTMVPATGCGVRSAHGGGPSGEAVLNAGGWVVQSFGTQDYAIAILQCGLHIGAVPLPGSSGPVTMTGYRVHYRDGDGHGLNQEIRVTVYANRVQSGSQNDAYGQQAFCRWASSASPTPNVTTETTFTVPCALTLQTGTYYTLTVEMDSGGGGSASFLGIDFP